MAAAAGLAAGATWGAAPGATVHALRVLGCDGVGNTFDSLAALNWIVSNHPRLHPNTRAVLSLSLGGPRSTAMNNAVAAASAAGFAVVAAAGNEAADACQSSPASAPAALTVAASDASDAQVWNPPAWEGGAPRRAALGRPVPAQPSCLALYRGEATSYRGYQRIR